MKPRRPTIEDSTRDIHSKRRSARVAARAARKAATKKAKLWQTAGMPKEGEIVTAKDYPGQAFKILKLQDKAVMIQRFDVSRQTLGELILTAPVADIAPFKEDASQAAVRIVREVTEGE